MSVSITSGQEKQITRFGADAIERVLGKLRLEKDGAQRVIEHGDEFTAAIHAAATTSLKDLSVSDKSRDEEVASSYGYQSGYKPKGIVEQTNRLRELFLSIGCADEQIASQPLPPNAEGWFAIPKWQTVAPAYGEATQKVLDLIKQTRNGKFCNYREGQLGPEYLRQHAKTAKAFQTLGDQQAGYDILIVPAQFGLHHRGRSVRRAREVMNANEFGLGAFAVGIMLLTHPEHLQHHDDLWIDCAGDEYSPVADGRFVCARYFGFVDGRVGFDAYWIDDPSTSCGAASGFLSPE